MSSHLPVIKRQSTMKGFWSTATLIALYYLVGVIVYCYLFRWSLFDALCVVTVNLSFFGRASYMTTHDNRLVGTTFSILGNVMTLYLFYIFVTFEIASAHTHVHSMQKRALDFNQKLTDIYQRRLYIPLVHLMVIIVIGMSFFAHIEYWSASDALCYAIMQNIVIGARGMLDHSLTIQRGTSKLFLLGYSWFFSVSLMHFVGNVCAYRTEYSSVLQEKRKSTTLLDFSALARQRSGEHCSPSGGRISTHEVLVHLLLQLEVLDKEADVDKWMAKIQRCVGDGNKDDISPQELGKLSQSFQYNHLHMQAMAVAVETKTSRASIVSVCDDSSNGGTRLHSSRQNYDSIPER